MPAAAVQRRHGSRGAGMAPIASGMDGRQAVQPAARPRPRLGIIQTPALVGRLIVANRRPGDDVVAVQDDDGRPMPAARHEGEASG